MLIKEFYVIPENEIDELFIDEEMSFLIDVSIKNRSSINSVEDYKKLIENKYNAWTERTISYG